VEWDREGKRLVLPLGAGVVPDSVVILNAWEDDGYPLGGSIRTAAAVPSEPRSVLPPTLAAVRYEGGTPGPLLQVELGGGDLPDSCAVFELEPGGLVLTEPLRKGASLELILPAPLAMGTYTLRLASSCARAPGDTRSFRVGAVFYPNPLRGGADLILEGLPVGARVRIFDVRGEEQLQWQVAGLAEARPIDLPPGLYFLRFDGAGVVAETGKLVVVR
jgi:hypothetical protein